MRIFTLLAVGLFRATGFAQQPAGPSATPDPVRREIMAYRLDDVRIMTLDSVVVFNALATTTTTKPSGERGFRDHLRSHRGRRSAPG
jgi:hypothetical protein